MKNLIFNPVLPRSQRQFFQDIISKDILDEFSKDPKQFLANNGIDVSELNIPKDFKVPPREVLEERFQKYFDYDEFSNTKHALVFIVFLIFLIPTPGY
jgi:hypothetical protein